MLQEKCLNNKEAKERKMHTFKEEDNDRLFKIEIFRDEVENGNVETEDKKQLQVEKCNIN